MKVSILVETDESTNGRIVGVYASKADGMVAFNKRADQIAVLIGDETQQESFTDDRLWSYLPDDTEDHNNISLTLFLDCVVQE